MASDKQIVNLIIDVDIYADIMQCKPSWQSRNAYLIDMLRDMAIRRSFEGKKAPKEGKEV